MKEKNEWHALWTFFKEEFRYPLGHPAFILYFCIFIVGIGCLTIFRSMQIQLPDDLKAISTIVSVSSYALALTAAAAVELALNKRSNIGNSLTVIAFGLVLIALVIFYTVGKTPINDHDWLLCFFGLFIALVFTWMTYGNHPQFRDKPLIEERTRKYNKFKKSIDENILID